MVIASVTYFESRTIKPLTGGWNKDSLIWYKEIWKFRKERLDDLPTYS